MEVHHHSHHPQKWKEYLQEFFMLFFAVFLGFMSEYYLEYRAERHKEQDYLKSMALDLESDLSEMTIRIKGMENIQLMTKRLEQLLYKPVLNENEIDSIYLLSTQITATLVAPNFTSGTIDQLKYAGGFRLIKNQEIVRKISDYERWKKTIGIQEDLLKVHWTNVHKMQNSILHMTTMNMTEKMNQIILDKDELKKITTTTGSGFLTNDKSKFYEYSNNIWVLGAYVSYYEIMIKMEQQNAINLAKLLEKEIHH